MLLFQVSNNILSWAHSTKNEHILMGIVDFIRFTSYLSDIICCDFLVFACYPWRWHNFKKTYTIGAKLPSIPGRISAKIKKFCQQKNYFLNFEVIYSKWVVVVNMDLDLSSCFYYPFWMNKNRKMWFLPLQRKKRVDVVPSKFEQNWWSRSWDIAKNVRGKKKKMLARF